MKFPILRLHVVFVLSHVVPADHTVSENDDHSFSRRKGWRPAAGNPFALAFVTGNGFSVDNFIVDLVPEPGALALLGLGFSGVIACRRRHEV